MLDDLFVSLLDLSGTASIVILVVMVARLGLKRLPKGISYALWAVRRWKVLSIWMTSGRLLLNFH